MKCGAKLTAVIDAYPQLEHRLRCSIRDQIREKSIAPHATPISPENGVTPNRETSPPPQALTYEQKANNISSALTAANDFAKLLSSLKSRF